MVVGFQARYARICLGADSPLGAGVGGGVRVSVLREVGDHDGGQSGVL